MQQLVCAKERKYTRKEVSIGRCRLRDCYRFVESVNSVRSALVVVELGRSGFDSTEQNVLDFLISERAVGQGNGCDRKAWALVRKANDIDLGR